MYMRETDMSDPYIEQNLSAPLSMTKCESAQAIRPKSNPFIFINILSAL